MMIEALKNKRKELTEMSLHDKYATKLLLNGAARNQTNRDGVNIEETTNTVKTDRDGKDHNFISLPSGTRNT